MLNPKIKLVLVYLLWLALAFFFMGIIDGLFFNPSLDGLFFSLTRKDLYFISITFMFLIFLLAFVAAFEIGKNLKTTAFLFLVFTLINILLFSFWAWGIGWMQISPNLSQNQEKELDLWRVGQFSVSIPKSFFIPLVVISFILHLLFFVFSLKSSVFFK